MAEKIGNDTKLLPWGVTLKVIKEFLNIPLDNYEEDTMLIWCHRAAISYIESYTGYSYNEDDICVVHDTAPPYDLQLCMLQIVSSNYNWRDHMGEKKLHISPFCQSVLAMHRQNLCC